MLLVVCPEYDLSLSLQRSKRVNVMLWSGEKLGMFALMDVDGGDDEGWCLHLMQTWSVL